MVVNIKHINCVMISDLKISVFNIHSEYNVA